MTESERELERSKREREQSEPERERSTGAESDDERAPTDYDDAADSFLSLEREITAAHVSDGDAYARIVDARRVSASSVPGDYPGTVRTDEALALELELDERRSTAYFEWPVSGPDGRLARLLSALSVPPAYFADLHGERVLVTVENGYLVPVVPASPPAGSPLGVYGMLAGLAFYLAGTISAVAGVGLPASIAGPLFLVVTFLVIPASTYLDAGYLRSHADWGGPVSRLAWTVLNAAPVVNVLGVLLYLSHRRRASWIRPR